MASIELKDLFVVVIEYFDNRKSPRVYGPFFSHIEAQAWLDAWPDVALCHRRKLFRPHSHPNQFKREIVPIVDLWFRNSNNTLAEIHS